MGRKVGLELKVEHPPRNSALTCHKSLSLSTGRFGHGKNKLNRNDKCQ